MKRVFKLKTFSRWAKRVIDDQDLCFAAREVERGLFEVDLGGGLCKKRVAVAGQGKSGSVRTLIAMEHEKAIFFLMGRKKSDSGSDFTDKVVNANKVMAGWLGAVTTDNLADMLANGVLKEICHEQ